MTILKPKMPILDDSNKYTSLTHCSSENEIYVCKYVIAAVLPVFKNSLITISAIHSAASPFHVVGRAAHRHSPFMCWNARGSVLYYCTIIHGVEHLRQKCLDEQWMHPYLCHVWSMAPFQGNQASSFIFSWFHLSCALWERKEKEIWTWLW